MLTLEANLRRKQIFSVLTIVAILFVVFPWPVIILGLDGVIPWFFSALILASLIGVRKRINNLEDLSSVDRVLHVVACLVVILYLLYQLYNINIGGLNVGLCFYGQCGSPSAEKMNSMSWGIILLVACYATLLFMPFVFMKKLDLIPTKK